MAGIGLSSGRSRGARMLAGGLSVALLGAVTAIAPVSAAPSVRFGATINGCTVYGLGPALKSIKVTWKDADGTLKHVQTVKSKANGRFQTTCDPDEQVERGDVFSAKIGTSPARTFTVPALGFRIDRVADTVSGKAPASTDLSIEFDGVANPVTTTTAGDGTFSVDTTGSLDIIGSVQTTVWFNTPAGDYVERSMQTPYLAAWRGRSSIYMQGRPGATVDVQLYDGPTMLANVDCTLGPTGHCWLDFTDADGHPIKARTGYRVVSADIASDADFLIPVTTVTGAAGTDVVAGTCDAAGSSLYYLYVWRTVGTGSASKTGMTNGSGRFSVDLTAKFDLRSGDKVLLQCGNAAGDWVERQITVP